MPSAPATVTVTIDGVRVAVPAQASVAVAILNRAGPALPRGRAAWQVMRSEMPQLFWRARAGNPVNDFYFDEAEGCMKGEKWNVFWYGLEGWEQVRYAVEHCLARPATLKG